MATSLEKQRYSDSQYSALSMSTFILSGCLRHVLGESTLREYIQTLFHLKSHQSMLPVARSTWSLALGSKGRRDVLLGSLKHLVKVARHTLPDRLANIEGLGGREVIATDATYQDESAHFGADYPMQGGVDNQKGHMLLSHYDVRHGIPLHAIAQTLSMGEMKVLKQAEMSTQGWLHTANAVHVVDRAFIDGRFWDQRLERYGATVITRTKSTMKIAIIKENEVLQCPSNDGVRYDREVSLLK